MMCTAEVKLGATRTHLNMRAVGATRARTGLTVDSLELAEVPSPHW